MRSGWRRQGFDMDTKDADLEAARRFLACPLPLAEMQAVPALAQILATVARSKLAQKKRPGKTLKTPRTAPSIDAKRRAGNDTQD